MTPPTVSSKPPVPGKQRSRTSGIRRGIGPASTSTALTGSWPRAGLVIQGVENPFLQNGAKVRLYVLKGLGFTAKDEKLYLGSFSHETVIVTPAGLAFGSSRFYNPTIPPAGPKAMNREYDLLERLHDDPVLWRGHVSGLESARLKLAEIAKETDNACFVMHLPSKEIVIRVNLTQNGTVRPPEMA